MTDRRKVRISYDGKGAPHTARITDAETGEDITYVTRVEFSLDVRKAPTAIVHVLMPVVEVTVDAEIHTHCPYCKQEMPDRDFEEFKAKAQALLDYGEKQSTLDLPSQQIGSYTVMARADRDVAAIMLEDDTNDRRIGLNPQEAIGLHAYLGRILDDLKKWVKEPS